VSAIQNYVTIVLTRTRYTTYIYSNSYSSPEASWTSTVSTTTTAGTSTLGSSYTSIEYNPTSLSSETTRSTTTAKTIVHVTNAPTVSQNSGTLTATTCQSDVQTTTTSSPATASSSEISGGHAGHTSSQMISSPDASKQAAVIAGSMTASLAGILLIGLLFVFFFRRRKRQLVYHVDKHGDFSEQPRMSSSSQALPFDVAAIVGMGRREAFIGPQRPPGSNDSSMDNRLRMGFPLYNPPDPRLQAHSSPLRLMNPDVARTPPSIIFNPSSSSSPSPATAAEAVPSTTTETTPPHTFLQRQRTALSAALLTVKRSLSSQDMTPQPQPPYSAESNSSHLRPSPLHIPQRQPPSPQKKEKLTMPSETILTGIIDRPVSSSAQSAMSSGTIIHNQVPYDPFYTTGPKQAMYLYSGNGNGSGVARRDFLAPPPAAAAASQPLRMTRLPVFQQYRSPSPSRQQQYQGNVTSALTRSCSVSPTTRSEVSSAMSLHSGPFDLASSSVVDVESGTSDGSGVSNSRGQREQTPNWEVYQDRDREIRVYEGT
jgi:LPXTG-motif cell wall-anchored protein